MLKLERKSKKREGEFFWLIWFTDRKSLTHAPKSSIATIVAWARTPEPPLRYALHRSFAADTKEGSNVGKFVCCAGCSDVLSGDSCNTAAHITARSQFF